MWISIWGIAIVVALLGGNWRDATSVPPSWKSDIQLPGILVVLYTGWLIGPFATMMTPPVICILTILTNVGVYYALVKMVLFFYGKVRE
jgi:hypothetical protein